MMPFLFVQVLRKVRNQSLLWPSARRSNLTVAVLSRHVLEHNTYTLSMRYINMVKASGATYFLGTNMLGHRITKNPNAAEMVPGGYRPINYYLPPFSFPPGIMSWLESPKSLGTTTMFEVWEVATLPTYPDV